MTNTAFWLVHDDVRGPRTGVGRGPPATCFVATVIGVNQGMMGMHPQKIIDIYKSLMYVCHRVSTRLQHEFDSASEMTYIVSRGALNSTHSLTLFRKQRNMYAFSIFLCKISVLHPFPK